VTTQFSSSKITGIYLIKYIPEVMHHLRTENKINGQITYMLY